MCSIHERIEKKTETFSPLSVHWREVFVDVMKALGVPSELLLFDCKKNGSWRSRWWRKVSRSETSKILSSRGYLSSVRTRCWRRNGEWHTKCAISKGVLLWPLKTIQRQSRSYWAWYFQFLKNWKRCVKKQFWKVMFFSKLRRISNERCKNMLL